MGGDGSSGTVPSITQQHRAAGPQDAAPDHMGFGDEARSHLAAACPPSGVTVSLLMGAMAELAPLSPHALDGFEPGV